MSHPRQVLSKAQILDHVWSIYVRVHSPVVWVEVDCQAPGPLAGAYGATQGSGATQMHVHSVIRTPNGTDYGRELLRQHYLTSPHHQ